MSKNIEKYNKLLVFDIGLDNFDVYIRRLALVMSSGVIYATHKRGDWNTYTITEKDALKKIRAIIDAYNIIEKK